MALTADEFIESELDISGASPGADFSNFGIDQAEKTSRKDYLATYIFVNVTSHSQLEELHECPRKFQIMKLPKVADQLPSVQSDSPPVWTYPTDNIHFAYGHSVGAGIQTYLVTQNKQQALFAAFLAWNGDYSLDFPKKKKNINFALLAVEKFIYFWESGGWSDEWEVATFNGQPATELIFMIDAENGYYHAGHVDAVLRNRRTGTYMVLELKTTSIKDPDEAMYGNSPQALGYSIIIDRIAEDLSAAASFEVLYVVYSTTEREFRPFPFTKNRAMRAEWLQDLLLDHASINTYVDLNFFPKRGEACWSFGRRCQYYGVCDLPASALGAGKESSGKRLVDIFKWMGPDVVGGKLELPEATDFLFTLSDLTRAIMKP